MTQISPDMYELLSAYLDGQVSARERTAVEDRLRSDAAARQALAELRQMRKMMRSLPTRKVPHNFTLTRAMAQEQRSPRAIPWLRLSSVLSGLVMVFLFLFQFSPALAPTAPAPAAAPQAESMKAMEEPAADAAASGAPSIIIWNGQPVGGMGGGGYSAPEGMGGAEVESTSLLEAPADTAIKTAPEMTPTPVSPAAVLPQATPAPTAEVLSQAPALAPSPAEAQPILGVNLDDAGQRSTPESARTLDHANREARPFNWLPWLQGGFAAAALGTGLAAYLLGQKHRRGR